METLYVRALLCAAGLAPEEAYTSCLHAQFLARPDDHLLLSLECTTDPYAAVCSLQSYFTCHPLDRSRFGRSLMAALRPAYDAAPDLRRFTDQLYILWSCLPAQLSQEQPFRTLSCLGDPLSWGDEAQTRQLCRTMLHHYDPT